MARRRALVGALFVSATLVLMYPLSARPGKVAVDLGPDTRLFLWTLSWDVNAVLREPLSLFDANIFHPQRRTLAYSEHQLASALTGLPALILTGNPLLAMNLVLLIACAGSGLGACLLARRVGIGVEGAVLAGIVFAFAPPRFFRVGQLHLATVQWMPLCLYLLHRYADSGALRHLLFSVGLFSLQALSGGQTALFLALAAPGLVVYLWLHGKLRLRLGHLAGGALLALALNIPFIVPYLQVSRDVGLERTLAEAESWSPNPSSFIASPTHLHRLVLDGLGLARDPQAYLFPGMAPLCMFLLAFARSDAARPNRDSKYAGTAFFLDIAIGLLVAVAILIEARGGIRIHLWSLHVSASSGSRVALAALGLAALRLTRYRSRPSIFGAPLRFLRSRLGVEGSFYALLVIFSIWAALGPKAGLYTVLYRIVPGFDFVRVPSRLTLLTLLGLAIVAGIGLEKLRDRRPLLARGALIVTLVELAAFPLETVPYPLAIPEMDRWLAKGADDAPVVVFPIPDPRDDIASARRHSFYMLYSRAHFLPLVNGYSGFTPPSHDRLFRTLAAFPNEEGVDALDHLNVRYAVFHRSGYRESDWKALIGRLDAMRSRLSLVAEFEEGRVYELSRGRRDRGSSGPS